MTSYAPLCPQCQSTPINPIPDIIYQMNRKYVEEYYRHLGRFQGLCGLDSYFIPQFPFNGFRN